jgi:hypothetical protein
MREKRSNTISIEKWQRIKERKKMVKARTRFGWLLDELFDASLQGIIDGKRIWKRTVDLTCEEAQQVLTHDYARVNTKRKGAEFDRLQQYFHKKYGIPLQPIPEGLGSRPDVLQRQYRMPRGK